MNENTDLRGRISRPYKTLRGDFRYEDDENVFLLFDYIDGVTVGKEMTNSQLLEAAEILACIHNVGNKIPIDMKKIKEDFSVPFCFSLDSFMKKNILQHRLI